MSENYNSIPEIIDDDEDLLLGPHSPSHRTNLTNNNNGIINKIKIYFYNCFNNIYNSLAPRNGFQVKFNIISIICFTILSILLILNITNSILMKSHINQLELRINYLETQLKNVNNIENEVHNVHKSLDNTIADVHLLKDNTTTNDDLVSEIIDMKGYMKLEFVYIRTNVTESLNMKKNDLENEFNHKIDTLQTAVAGAEARVMEAKEEIDGKVKQLSSSFKNTSVQLHEAVTSATDMINQEVKHVEDYVEAYVAATNDQFAAENDFVKFQLAGTLTLIGCLISGSHITNHMRHMHKPTVQRRIMPIMMMVPVYGITSWLSMIISALAPFLELVRDWFEAYAVYSFIGFLMAVLEDGEGLNSLVHKVMNTVQLQLDMETENPEEFKKYHKLAPPFPIFYDKSNAWSIATSWLYQCKLMTLQFVIAKPCLSLAPMLVYAMGFSTDEPLFKGHFLNLSNPMLYINALEMATVTLAFYGLLSFYHGAEKELRWCNPWPKFLCIKGVVFATFWQNAILQALADVDFIDKRSASQIQNLLICIEMLIAALAHVYVFTPEEWHDGWRTADKAKNLLQEGLALKEFAQDFKQLYQPWDKFGVERQLNSSVNSNISNRGRNNSQNNRNNTSTSNQNSNILDSGGSSSTNPRSRSLNQTRSSSKDYGSIRGSGVGLGSSVRPNRSIDIYSPSPFKVSQRSELGGIHNASGHGSQSWEDFLDGHDHDDSHDDKLSPQNNNLENLDMHDDYHHYDEDEEVIELENDEEHPENAKLLQYALSEAAKALEQQGQVDAYGRPFNMDNDDDLADVERRRSQIEASTELVRDVLQRMKSTSINDTGDSATGGIGIGIEEDAIRGDVGVSPTARLDSSRPRSSSVDESDMAHF